MVHSSVNVVYLIETIATEYLFVPRDKKINGRKKGVVEKKE